MGKHQLRLLKFAIRYQDWQSFGKDKSTVTAVYTLARIGLLEVNRKTRQFRLSSTMSHAEGQVRFADGLVLFAEYNGTSDLFCTRLHPTYAEMKANWRKDVYRKCSCGMDEPVELAHNYGFCAEFAGGRACRHCLAITDDPSLWDYDDKVKIETNGKPDWWVKHESTNDC